MSAAPVEVDFLIQVHLLGIERGPVLGDVRHQVHLRPELLTGIPLKKGDRIVM